ncbi:histone-lysine N-methyltransferase, H3 lysine-9 specific SUVH1-like [Lolium rigidum]|uniref:histone-lysine N-methyltransferase, H3 lysine-9 specific SUVH1-like n=1 Tax=Lolium rigidum TaxID=89674 RepID=UPI001F5D4201|nr:histone-lysine N-methyltransferase, H3 lysine-9 specific SUVH1-like [Lolium rigidum]XP_047094391.1 histone-lysine N-methyltransferase, H3 lysine-9 specific SUVH1-like [Lolium rigidum]
MDRATHFIPGPNQELLDIKPLRSLAPMFPAPMGVNINQSSTPPLVCVTPVGQFPTGFGAGNLPAFGSFATFSATANGFSHGGTSANGPIDATPISAYKTRSSGVTYNGDDEPHSGNQTRSSERKAKRSATLAADGTKIKRPKPVYKNLVAGKELAFLPPSNSNPRETVEVVHMIFEALRRRHLQMDETQDASRRADLKAGAIMMASNIRANVGKKVGTAPGVEIGDIFYFRMELCIIGLHAPSMGGIDYMSAKFGNDEDSVAICIVAAGGYENEDDDTDTLVYSGSGGNSRNTEERHDQKLERGNLALERSLHRKNEIRVVRGFKDPACVAGKIYIYDGLYKIQESWKERTKFGINCFKYRLQREPGQRDGAAIWKMTQQWIQNASTRGRVLLADLSSGAETMQVCLVNEVDHEKGPGHFTYTNEVKYLRPLSSMRPLQGCHCQSVCLPGDSNCDCGQHNGGDLPYNSSGVLVCRRPVIYECGEACHCSLNCRNRVTQKGNRYHFEVFRTTNRGWGLRCWDPIRAGAFICEYVGEVIDELKVNLDDSEDDYIFQTVCPGEKTLKWNFGPELLGEESTYVSADEFEPLPIKISAKTRGNVSRFMNHSCSPNVFWQPVQYNHGDDKHPHIMFFALNHIPPMTELTFDYGVVGEPSIRTRNCLCGSSACRRVF